MGPFLKSAKISGPYFPVFGLIKEIHSVNLRIQSDYRKIGPEITPYLDLFTQWETSFFVVLFKCYSTSLSSKPC